MIKLKIQDFTDFAKKHDGKNDFTHPPMDLEMINVFAKLASNDGKWMKMDENG